MLQVNPEEVSLQASAYAGPLPALAWTMSYSQRGSSRHTAQETALSLHYFTLFSLKITIFSLCCDFSFLACLSSAVTVHACFYFSTPLKMHTGFFNVTPLSVFKACGALFPGLYEVGLAKSIGRALPQKCHRYKVFPAQLGSPCHIQGALLGPEPAVYGTFNPKGDL